MTAKRVNYAAGQVPVKSQDKALRSSGTSTNTKVDFQESETTRLGYPSVSSRYNSAMTNDAPSYHGDVSISADYDSVSSSPADLGETPKSFADILPPSLITSSSLSAAKYYKKSKFTKAVRRFTVTSSAPSTGAENVVSVLPSSKSHTRGLSLDAQTSQRERAKRHPEGNFASPCTPPVATTTMEQTSVQEKETSHYGTNTFNTMFMPRKPSAMKKMVKTLRRTISSAGTFQSEKPTDLSITITKKSSKSGKAGKRNTIPSTKSSGKGGDKGPFHPTPPSKLLATFTAWSIETPPLTPDILDYRAFRRFSLDPNLACEGPHLSRTLNLVSQMTTKHVTYAADLAPAQNHAPPTPSSGMRVKIQVPEKPPKPSRSTHSPPSSEIDEDDDDDANSDSYSFISTPSDSPSPSPTSTEPPRTFADILPPTLITTSSISETGYYNKSKFANKGKGKNKTRKRSTLASAMPITDTNNTISGLPSTSSYRGLPPNAPAIPNHKSRKPSDDDEDFETPWAPSTATTTLERMRAPDDKPFKYDPKSYSPSPASTKGHGHAKSYSHSSTFSTSSAASNHTKNSPSSSRVKEMMTSLRRSITSARGKGAVGVGTDRSYLKKHAMSKSEDFGREGEGSSSVFGTLSKSSGTGAKGDEGYSALSD
ncbi:hypothetical protein CPB83DRAFT_909274 [Crepidotus variabilis]|uniref:Uncharacterized protein n=1 Tax=Crepidotus variabilis TaxID=179855 RepID=A0A9P6EA31_9AGAR|nr:hypothetical protein CPB83DRAFT_909274 [Crepidotus variabilis]